MIDRHYKDKAPHETIKFLQEILDECQLSTSCISEESNKNITQSLRINIKGTGIGQNGKGVSEEYALASGYGEFFERLQNDYMLQFNFSRATQEYGGFYNYIDEKFITAKEFLQQDNSFLRFWLKEMKLVNNTLEEQEAIIVNNLKTTFFKYDREEYLSYAFYSIKDDKSYFLPHEIYSRIYLSNGMCSGNTMEEALIQGLSEIWERYVHIRVMKEGIALPDIPDKYIEQCKNVKELINNLKQQKNYKVILKDASLGGIFPAAMLIIVNLENHSYGVRFGAHINMEIAIERTVTEAFQGKGIKEFSSFCKLDATNAAVDKFINMFNSLKIGLGNFPVEIFYKQSAYGFCEPVAPTSNKDALKHYINYFTKLGYDIMVRDVSYLGFPTYQMIIPGMSEAMPCDLVYYKLQNTSQYVSKILPDISSLDTIQLDYIVRLIDSKSDCIIESDFPYFYMLPIKIKFLGNENGLGYMVFAAICRYAQGKFQEAYNRLSRFINSTISAGFSVDNYLQCALEYIGGRNRNLDNNDLKILLINFFDKETVDKVCYDFLHPSKVLENIYPKLNCFKCEYCVYSKYCDYKTIDTIKRTLKNKQVSCNFSQDDFIKQIRGLL